MGLDKIEKIFKVLDECRLNGDDDYIKREKLMIEFRISQSAAERYLDMYSRNIYNRPQFLTED